MSKSTPIEAVEKYISSNTKSPFFVVVCDKDYTGTKEKLSQLGFTVVRVSDYCNGDDSLPDIDALLEHLKSSAADINARLVVVGLGEYLALRGKSVTRKVISHLKDLTSGNVVILLRWIGAHIKRLQKDPRFGNRRCHISNVAPPDISLVLAVPSVQLSDLRGFKALLQALEDGANGTIVANTSIDLKDSTFAVRRIPDAYNGIRHVCPAFDLPPSCGSDEHWAELLVELRKSNSLDSVFAKHKISDSLETRVYDCLAGSSYENWLCFIALKSRISSLANHYLRFVFQQTDCFDDLLPRILEAIIEVPLSDERFNNFYAERKELIKGLPESDIASFVVKNRKSDHESIYRLTDNTRVEREEIIAWVSKRGVIDQIADIYPDLDAYLKTYVFHCDDLSSLLIGYFDEYKQQKVSNIIKDHFLEKVEKLAESRDFNRLPARDEIISKLNNDETYLYWLDALGVEYLSFITQLVSSKGLSVSFTVARAQLPTITSMNRGFYDDWPDNRKEKDGRLDDTKHTDEGGYSYTGNVLPIHLARELEIISEVIDKAHAKLNERKYKRILIVSDHGASRLAVLRKKEEKYDTDTKGERSGRCCKLSGSESELNNMPYATKENGYIVLADYGRFKGSRAANVEVHGGASLEEVLVPIIELTLKDSVIKVELVERLVTVDFQKGAEVKLFVDSRVKDLSLLMSGKRYLAEAIDDNHYLVVLPEVNRAGEYKADVFIGDNFIESISIKTRGRSAKLNEAFEDLF